MYVIVISIDTIIENREVSKEFISLYEEFKEEFYFIFVSIKPELREIIKLEKKIDKNMVIIGRTDARKVLSEEKMFKIVLGFKDADFILANNIEAIFFKSSWKQREDKAEEYGIEVSYETLRLVLKMILNNNSFYYKLEIDEKTTLLSILDPRTHQIYCKTDEERELINNFNEILKNNKKENLNILKLLFLIMINKLKELDGVKYWSSFPSSKGEPSENMQSIEKEIRYLKKQIGKNKKRGLGDIFIRTTPIDASHKIAREKRIGCERHFNSIILNSQYKNKLEGKKVCILDDYATNGTTSEVCRNLLKNEKLNKLYILTLGKFNAKGRADYLFQDFDIRGDVYSENYEYNLIETKELSGEISKTSDEIKKLYEIISK